jgi:hypothetical protein
MSVPNAILKIGKRRYEMPKQSPLKFYDYEKLAREVQRPLAFDANAFASFISGDVLQDSDEGAYPLLCWEEMRESYGPRYPQWESVMAEFAKLPLEPAEPHRAKGKAYSYVRVKL